MTESIEKKFAMLISGAAEATQRLLKYHVTFVSHFLHDAAQNVKVNLEGVSNLNSCVKAL